MVTLDGTACDVAIVRQGNVRALSVELSDGRRISAPLDWFPALGLATEDQAEHYEIADDGLSIAWQELGECVSVAFLLTRRTS